MATNWQFYRSWTYILVHHRYLCTMHTYLYIIRCWYRPIYSWIKHKWHVAVSTGSVFVKLNRCQSTVIGSAIMSAHQDLEGGFTKLVRPPGGLIPPEGKHINKNTPSSNLLHQADTLPAHCSSSNSNKLWSGEVMCQAILKKTSRNPFIFDGKIIIIVYCIYIYVLLITILYLYLW